MPESLKISLPTTSVPGLRADLGRGKGQWKALSCRRAVSVARRARDRLSCERGPECSTELMVPVAVPVLVTCTMKLLGRGPMGHVTAGNVMVPPGCDGGVAVPESDICM